MHWESDDGIQFVMAACERALKDDRVGKLLAEACEAADGGDIDAALQLASEAQRACPSYADGAALLGALLHGRGQRESAAAQFARAIQYDEANQLALWHLAVDESAGGRHDGAATKLELLRQFTHDPAVLATQSALLHLHGQREAADRLDRQLAQQWQPIWNVIGQVLSPLSDAAAAGWNEKDPALVESIRQLASQCREVLGRPPQAPQLDNDWTLPDTNMNLLRSRFGQRIVAEFQATFLRLIVAPGLFARLRGTPLARRLNLPNEPAADPDMVVIPAGRYVVGSDQADLNNPKRHLRLDAPLLIDRYPVTNQQWRQFDSRHTYSAGLENHPVANVDAVQAELFARWHGKRLPSETEWEIAARGTKGLAFPWGMTATPKAANCAESKRGGPTAVTQHPEGVSFCGAMDMSGNVREWTSSWINLAPDAAPLRITKGGDFMQPVLNARPEVRSPIAPRTLSPLIGFRCVRDY